MAETSELQVKISADSKEYQDELDKLKDSTKELENQLKSVALISGAAFSALVAEAGLAIKAFEESDSASRKLEQSLRNQGVISTNLATAYKKQASELQKLTGIDDDAIIKGDALLQTFIGQNEITKELATAMADLSTATGSVESAAEILGRGIQGNTRALKSLGIVVDENLTKSERQAQIIEKVNALYGGQAEAANKGVGSIKGLTSAFDNFQEAIGERLAPVFTLVVQKLTQFLEAAANNKPLLDLAVTIGGAVTAALGAISAVAGLRLAMIALTIASEGFIFTPLGAALAAVGVAAGLVGGYLANTSVKASGTASEMDKLRDELDQLNQEMDLVNKRTDLSPALKEEHLAPKIKQVEALKDQILNLEEAQRKMESAGNVESPQDKAAREAAEARTREENRQNAAILVARKEHIKAMEMENDNASQELITLKEKEVEILNAIANEQDAQVRAQLITKLEQQRTLLNEAQLMEQEDRQAHLDTILMKDEEYRNLDDEQRALFREKYQSDLATQFQNEKTTRQIAIAERAQQQIEADNKFIKDKQKHNAFVATMNQIFNSEQFKGAQQASSELVQLQQSSNSTLKSIGKAAAISQITMKTAQSAMNVFEGFTRTVPPPFGIALGIAGAAAAVAFGAEQISKATGAAEGGIMTGGIPGVDSIPTMTMPGELVVPTKNFEEVVSAVAAQRTGETTTPTEAGASAGVATIILELKNDLMDFVEAKLVERQNLNLSIQGT